MYTKVLAMFAANSGWKLIVFLAMLLATAILEMAGVGLIMPLIAIIDRPEILQSNQWLNSLYNYSGSTSSTGFLVWCSFVLIAFYIVKNIFVGFIIYWQSLFLARSESEVSIKLLETYLYMPYSRYLERNPVELVNNINNEVNILFSWFLKPLFIIITDTLIVLSILALLTYIAPLATLSGIVVIVLSCAAFYLPLRKPLAILGKSRLFHREKMVQWINQSLGSLKEIVVLGRRDYFKDSFSKHANETIVTQTFYETVTQAPRLVIETIGVVTLLAVTIVVLYSASNFLPTLSVFAMAAFRMMPAINRIMNCAAKLRYYISSLNIIYKDLAGTENSAAKPGAKELVFKDKITIHNLSFSYPDNDKKIINNINLDIKKGASIGIIGHSGAGKSTFVDILLGLLSPSEGNISIDGVDLQDCLASWRKHISYIPQSIYLTDDTIRRNIALGINDSDIDDAKIWQALEQAELAETIRELPEGLNTSVGERGIRLSGGQRQRIGIARAFYNEPDVLILDEATTGLDPKTENSICETLKNMKKNLTLIAISHQPALTAVADTVYLLDKGKLQEQK